MRFGGRGRGAGAWVSLLALAGALASGGAALAAASLAEPSLSPDGREIAFVSGGDIWTAPAGGGEARLLVTDPATESRPIYSPDGTKLAFMSNRAGSTNIYILTLSTGELKRLTWAETSEQLDGWSRDGKWIYFSSAIDDVARQDDIFRVSAEGGTPLEVSRERYLNEFQSAPSPDGSTVALMAKGLSNIQWWRNGHSHIDETELWLKPVAEGQPYRRLLAADAKHAFPMWSPDGATIYFMSDASGAENIWKTPAAGGAPQQVTHFTDGRVLWPSIGYDGRSIVFERGFGIWRLDLAGGQAAPVEIALRGYPASAGDKHLKETAFRRMALSPDGKKVAVIAHGEVFATPSGDGGAAERITHTAVAETDVLWSPDSRRLLYVSDHGTGSQLSEYDFATARSEVLTPKAELARTPSFAPDGKRIAYIENQRELHVLVRDPKGGAPADRLLYTGALQDNRTGPVWSPDGKWLAFLVTDHRSFTNLYVIPAEGGEARPITFLADGETGSRIAWSPDGTFIVFDAAQRSERGKLVRVDLLPHTPKYREDAFRELFKPADAPDRPTHGPDRTRTHGPQPPSAPAGADDDATPPPADAKPGGTEADAAKPKKDAVKPVRIVFEGIRERATVLPIGMDVRAPVISPDGKTLVFAVLQGDRENLYRYSLDELASEPPSPVQVTATPHDKADYAFTPDSKTLFYRDNGHIVSTPLDAIRPKALAVTAEMDVDFDTEKMVVFDEVWSTLNRRFFDAGFNGHDWKKIGETYRAQVQGARTGDEMRRIINLMIGELDASHSGISHPADPDANLAHVGDLGLRFAREPYEAGKGLVIREVVALGPAAIEGSIKPGETLVAVDGQEIGPHGNLDRLLLGKTGKRTVLKVRDAAGHVREAVVRPVSVQTAAGLLYRQWVNDRRAYVDRISGGRIGYVHIADMSDDSLAQLYIDLDAENEGKQGVVIDIRNNNGGYVNGYALDVFARRNYLNLTERGFFPTPSRQALGQRALGLPTVLVTNESSLSDAEDFTEGYRSLGLGKVVGQPTAGWIIYTGAQPLIDGSVVRVPGVRVQDLRGQTMEMHPRPVDVAVERPLGETETGQDAQLQAAVQVLLGK